MADEPIKEVLERIDVSLERLEVTNERIRLEVDRNRAFTRETLERYDRLAREVSERWEAEAQAGREVFSALVAQINEMRKEIRAQTDAIFRVIDRLDGSGGPSPATS